MQDNISQGDCTYTAAAAIAAGLCLIQSTTAGEVAVPTTGLIPIVVSKTAATAAAETIECAPIEPGREMRVKSAGTITAGDKCEIVLSGASAGKVITHASGVARFIALESAVTDDLFKVRALTTNGIPTGQGTPATLNSTATMSATDLTAGIITSSTAAAVTGTTRTGTEITAELTWVPVGGSWDVSIINTGGSNAFTLAAGASVSIVGSATVAASTSGRFRFRRSALTTWIAYRI